VNVERIHWPLHAQRRLQERGIDVAEVEDVIRRPDQLLADAKYPGRWVAQRRVGTDRPALLRVVYADIGGGEVVVVSAYRTTQIARYWRTDT
jgi:uncharacterized DUF497 family protein